MQGDAVVSVPTGRRRAREGAVSVADLLRRQRPRPAQWDYYQYLADELTRARAANTEERLPPAALRVTMCVLAALLMCGAAGAVSAIIARPASSAARPAASSRPIHGASALRPDLLQRAQWPYANNGGFSLDGNECTFEDYAADQQKPLFAFTAANPSAGSTSSGPGLVHEFYELLGTDPAAATALLAPGLLGKHRADVTRAWGEFTEVSTGPISVEPGGSILAEITARRRDDSRVAFRHRFIIGVGSDPRIVDAQLLAARITRPANRSNTPPR